MRNKLLACLMAVLFVFQFYFFLIPAYAATCTADCGDGTSVSCSGASCIAKDGVGCEAYNADGKKAATGSCIQPE